MTDRATTWAETRRCLCDDAIRLRQFQKSKFGYRLRLWFVDPAWAAVLLYRLSALAWGRGHRKLGRLMMQINSLVTGTDIHPASRLGPGLLIPSPCGVTISCKAGRNLTALGLSGVGGTNEGRDAGAGPGLPVLGDDVTVGPFCGIQNGIRVGDGASTEGGAGALKDVPPGVRMVLAASPLAGPAADQAVPPHRQLPACPHNTWSRTKADIRADIDRYLAELSRHHPVAAGVGPRLSAFLTNGVFATALHRIAHWQHAKGKPRIAGAIARINLLFNRLTITPDSCIGGGLFVPHLAGTLFRGHAGSNLTLYANSLCAPSGAAVGGHSTLHTAPVLGDNVTVGGHGAVIGPVVVGNHVRVAPKAQVMRDVADQMDAFSPMARFARGGVATDRAATDRPVPAEGSPTAEPLPWTTARKTMRDRTKHDRSRAAGHPGFPGLTCARLHRLSHALFVSGHRRLARWTWLLNAVLTGADISPASDLGPGLVIPHPAGICIHATAGSGLTLLAQTGVGPSSLIDGELPPLSLAPSVGEDVHLAHHSGIFGEVRIGNRVRLMAGCIATRPVSDDVTLSPRPLRSRPTGSHGAGQTADDDRA
jgi:serine O-acetyltransferase